MRKLIATFGALAVAVALAAPAAAKSTPTVGSKVKIANGSVTFTAYEQPVSADNTGKDAADAGMEYAAAEVEACSTATKKQQVTPFMFILALPDGTKALATSTVKQPALFSALLGKGQCAEGWVTFAVPQGTRPTQLLFGKLGSPTAKWKIPAT